MSDRAKDRWNVATVISLLALIVIVLTATIRGGVYLGEINAGVGRLVKAFEAVEVQIRDHEKRITALENQRLILDGVDINKLRGLERYNR